MAMWAGARLRTRAAAQRGPVEQHQVSALHPQEALLQTLAAAQRHPAGRAALRQRVVVEHTLSRIGQIQGPRARYKGVRKNTLDLRRTAAVANLQRVARLPAAA